MSGKIREQLSKIMRNMDLGCFPGSKKSGFEKPSRSASISTVSEPNIGASTSSLPQSSESPEENSDLFSKMPLEIKQSIMEHFPDRRNLLALGMVNKDTHQLVQNSIKTVKTAADLANISTDNTFIEFDLSSDELQHHQYNLVELLKDYPQIKHLKIKTMGMGSLSANSALNTDIAMKLSENLPI
jgi:hypothetical protein